MPLGAEALDWARNRLKLWINSIYLLVCMPTWAHGEFVATLKFRGNNAIFALSSLPRLRRNEYQSAALNMIHYASFVLALSYIHDILGACGAVALNLMIKFLGAWKEEKRQEWLHPSFKVYQGSFCGQESFARWSCMVLVYNVFKFKVSVNARCQNRSSIIFKSLEALRTFRWPHTNLRAFSSVMCFLIECNPRMRIFTDSTASEPKLTKKSVFERGFSCFCFKFASSFGNFRREHGIISKFPALGGVNLQASGHLNYLENLLFRVLRALLMSIRPQ